MSKYVMAIDQGTTSSRCIIFNAYGEIITSMQKEITQIYPKAGWVEHDANEIWKVQLSVATEALLKGNIAALDIAAIGITNQRETVVVWDKRTGLPVCNAIVWQCRRSAAYCDQLKKEGYDICIKEKTGLILDAYFSATKVKWILDNTPGAREDAEKSNLLFGTIDTWLIWNLTGGRVHATDYSNASRTMLYNIYDLEWDKELLTKFNIPESMLPEVKPSSGLFGYSSESIFGVEIPITGDAGDQQAALFGQASFEEGCAKNTYGTGCFLLMNTGYKPVKSSKGLLTTIAWGYNNKVEYALEGSIFVAGAAVQWLRDEMKLISNASETETLALSVEDTNGVYMVPAFVGLGAPYWDPYARGTIVGITRGVKKEHIVRATLEAIAYQTYDILKAMELDSEIHLKELKVDGGASANDFLLQFQSNILGVDVIRPETIETTALGAAYLAGLAVGYWKNVDEIKSNWKVSKRFKSDFHESNREELLKGWHEAVNRSMGWVK